MRVLLSLLVAGILGTVIVPSSSLAIPSSADVPAAVEKKAVPALSGQGKLPASSFQIFDETPGKPAEPAAPANSTAADWLKILVGAAIGALLSYFATMRVERWKAMREPRKEISFKIRSENSTPIRVNSAIRAKIVIQYGGKRVRSLSFITADFKNTGNQLITDQEIRLTFPDDAVLLDTFFDPEPEPDYSVEQVPLLEGDPDNSVRYRIGHLDVGRSIHLRFVASGGRDIAAKLLDHNPAGGVRFRQDISVASAEAIAVERFRRVFPRVTTAFLGLMILSMVLLSLGFSPGLPRNLVEAVVLSLMLAVELGLFVYTVVIVIRPIYLLNRDRGDEILDATSGPVRRPRRRRAKNAATSSPPPEPPAPAALMHQRVESPGQQSPPDPGPLELGLGLGPQPGQAPQDPPERGPG